MKPPPFDYVAARSVDHAVELLNGGTDARILAGGQSLLPLLNLRLASPEMLVDIGRIPELQEVTIDDGVLVVGAGAAQADVAADPRVVDGWPLLSDAIAHIGHPQIRNRGTVCGSLAHNDPLAELPAVALALDAEVVVAGADGVRTVAAPELFTGPFMTSIEAGELVVAVRFPALRAGTGCSLCEFATRPGDFATAGVATRLTVVDGVIGEARVVSFGLGPGPQRATGLEEALVGATGPALGPEALARFDASIGPSDDVHASADARRQLAATLVARSVAEAWERSR